MNMINQNTISFMVLALISILFLAKHYKKIKFATPFNFISLYVVTIISYLLISISELSNKNQLLGALFLTIVSLLQCFYSLLVTDELSRKKMQTLWKSPIIAFLAGMYFELNHILYISIGYILITIFIIFRAGEKYRYLKTKSSYLIICLGLLIGSSLFESNLKNYSLILIILGSSSILDMLAVKSYFKKELI